MPPCGSCPKQRWRDRDRDRAARNGKALRGKRRGEIKRRVGFVGGFFFFFFRQQFTKLQGMPSTSVDEAQDLEEGESANQLRMVLSSDTLCLSI